MCTGIRFNGATGSMYFGRNLDWTQGYGEKVVVTPAAATPPLFQHIKKSHGTRGIQSGRKLVQQQQRRFLSQRFCQRYPLHLAAGKFPHGPLRQPRGPYFLQRRSGGSPIRGTVHAPPGQTGIAPEQHKVPHQHTGKKKRPLRQHGKTMRALAGPHPGKRLPEKQHLTACGRMQPGQQTKQRCLAAAVAPQQRNSFSRNHPQADAMQHGVRTIGGVHVQSFQDCVFL